MTAAAIARVLRLESNLQSPATNQPILKEVRTITGGGGGDPVPRRGNESLLTYLVASHILCTHGAPGEWQLLTRLSKKLFSEIINS
ncbi:hypothetical protein AVEN_60220-1 [Araneus ventricosus]|uniref:Uncharacterized protein n=1 Tax=Araneus ventricosus TaxID=182803 RepID=A0A4Y2CM72_ARAVE|nr:hypothetical protein AVEN_60220-1 [Araneus ventricosus]